MLQEPLPGILHRNMRRLLKFLHTVGSVGLMGGLAAYMIVLAAVPAEVSLETEAAVRGGLAELTKWIIFPSMAVCVLSGLLAIAVHYPFAEAPWVWLKAFAGILVFEATLFSVDGPARKMADAASRAVAGEIDAATLATLLDERWLAYWTLLFLFAANIALAIWRPRFGLKTGRR